ncbi:ATP-dependent helicase/nuclease subunit A [Ketogulonicigenium robustum]|uniref:DNA 3'-5' helicase n=1 Tax=Ketogulonicigenium robustum TaxID=92947 RepID=A0A1W6P2H0_9RHOB|nr:double-strand break repair helicase AddA [Ketogulonicigenium robustum]ARO15712.1 ATP-dependent helicase/nuclease subunit A [Ketogulonicigenium robustum]
MTDLATQRQVQAARPRASTWLSANAGSGKTRVLTDRVARLLLDGVDPQNILCLTYTKAAAAEMQNRLFRSLGLWAMMDDDALQAQLLRLGADNAVDADQLATARRLFAQAMEVPGGLKIQTIHAFCASVLRRFPLEAGITPAFTEMEDRAAELLRQEVAEDMALGADRGLIDDVMRHLGGGSFDDFLATITAKRAHFMGPAFTESASTDALYDALDLPTGTTRADAYAIAVTAADRKLAQDVASVFKGLSKNYESFAAQLQGLSFDAPTADDLATLADLFITKSGEFAGQPKVGRFPQSNHKAAIAAMAPIADEVFEWMERTGAALDRLKALDTLEKSIALDRFARAFVPAYETQKLLRGQLDFDDLIEKTRALLQDSAVAQWVLFRLDGGIDHILVDEAQDTSPRQWQVIAALAQEFAAGDGQRTDRPRTIFVVGDMKQSIYSFQGADPTEFQRMRDDFAARLRDAGDGLNTLALEHSFRSSWAILRLVDAVFTNHQAGLGDKSTHIAFKENLPGRVDLWPPVVASGDAPDLGEWFDPVDLQSPMHPSRILAERVADACADMVAHHWLPSGDGTTRRRVSEGDILILVQRRSAIFGHIIAALKARGLRVAGADRLRIGAELAVRDVMALLKFLSLAEDDLSLAAALKSPLLGFTEQDLFTLAHARPKGAPLWQALRAADAPEVLAILNDLRDHADFLRPYDLINRLLLRHNGRLRLLARLGQEAEDGIDALLSQALAYEEGNIPSLTGFIEWMEADALEIKRQQGSGANQIRVMTVHGSKGLESPIVIMPETEKRRPARDDAFAIHPDGTALWPSSPAPDAVGALRDAARQARNDERLRLLYVALTRAECWLIVCAAGDTGAADDSWYSLVETGLQATGALPALMPGGEGLRLAHLDWMDLHPAPDVATAITLMHPISPDIAAGLAPAMPPISSAQVLSPSDLGGAKVMAGEVDADLHDIALLRGTIVHLLLEHLPQIAPAMRHARGAQLVGLVEDYALAGPPEALVRDAIAILDNPANAALFQPDGLPEVALTADIAGRRFHGIIDRLIVTGDTITAIDFKTNRVAPTAASATPEGVLRQMGAYYAMLRTIYPERVIRVMILWTATGELMDVPPDVAQAALGRALDAAGVGPYL